MHLITPEAKSYNSRDRNYYWWMNFYISTHCTNYCGTHPECCSHIIMPHLSGLNLVHPITSDKKFTISILIGTDHYWKFVQDTIARGEDPTAQESKLRCLLSRPLPSSLSQTVVTSSLLQMATVTSEEPLRISGPLNLLVPTLLSKL